MTSVIQIDPVTGSTTIITRTAMMSTLFVMPRCLVLSLLGKACRRLWFFLVAAFTVITLTSKQDYAESAHKLA
ncbi:MAG: hypothetical protein ACXV5T_09225 [Halobacteriota archaeon]